MPTTQSRITLWDDMLYELRENPRRAVHIVLWLLTGFLLPIGLILVIQVARVIGWGLGQAV